MALLRNIFWLAMFVAATFGFTVLFEHGTDHYFENARKEVDSLSKLVNSKPERKKDPSESVQH